MNNLSWVGSEKDFVNKQDVRWVNHIAVGRFGGNSSAGQTKNEDGCVIWQNEDWEFAAILDAHKSAESTKLVIDTLEQFKSDFVEIINIKGFLDFKYLEVKLLGIFKSEKFLDKCRCVTGETAFLS